MDYLPLARQFDCPVRCEVVSKVAQNDDVESSVKRCRAYVYRDDSDNSCAEKH